MKNKTKPILLVDRAEKTSIHDPPEPSALILSRREEFKKYPFPLSRDQQFELLYLIRTRKSGIVTREELQNIIFIEPTLH